MQVSIVVDNGSDEGCVAQLPDLIEKTIRDSGELQILEYTYTVLNRKKMFVYTP